MKEKEVYQHPLHGYKITIKRGTFAGWVGLIHYPNEVKRKPRTKVQGFSRDEVKRKISDIIGHELEAQL